MNRCNDLREYLSKFSGQKFTKEQLIDCFLNSKFESEYHSMSVNELVKITAESGIEIDRKHSRLSCSGKAIKPTMFEKDICNRLGERAYKTEPVKINKEELQKLLKHNSVGVLSRKLGLDKSTIYNKIRKFGLGA